MVKYFLPSFLVLEILHKVCSDESNFRHMGKAIDIEVPQIMDVNH